MIRLAVLVVALCIATLARSEPYAFADLQWGATKGDATRQLLAKGFIAATDKDKDGDLRFTGALMGHKAIVFTMFADGKLAKVIVGLLTPGNRAIDVYRDMKSALTTKYGPPESSHEFFQKPYFEGDGYAEQAIRVGKGHFSSFWRDPASDINMALMISELLSVGVAYESPEWAGEAAKRKAKETSVF